MSKEFALSRRVQGLEWNGFPRGFAWGVLLWLFTVGTSLGFAAYLGVRDTIAAFSAVVPAFVVGILLWLFLLRRVEGRIIGLAPRFTNAAFMGLLGPMLLWLALQVLEVVPTLIWDRWVLTAGMVLVVALMLLPRLVKEPKPKQAQG